MPANPVSANPVLVELTRRPRVESFHRGAVAVARADGGPVLALGDVARPIFPRSAIKLFQAVPLVEQGAADAFAFTGRELALACASHSADPIHLETARGILAKAGQEESALACGACWPLGEAAARALMASGAKPQAIHNPCSGKHAAMLALARHMGESLQGYERAEHPVQRRIHEVMQSMTGVTLGEDRCGIDGCSVPTWATPLEALARAFARLATGEGIARPRAEACARLMRACMAEPEFVEGQGRFCTEAMRRLPGLFIKGGAEAVYCGALPEQGTGFALKIDDGAKRGADHAMAAVLAALIPGADASLAAFLPSTLRNWRGIEVGHIGPSRVLTDALAECAAAV
jgi:L-asparaginase II